MAITFPNGFNISSNEPVDSRFVMTKAEMLAAKKARMPEVYFTICKDDGKMYVYNAENELNNETGYFRMIEATTTVLDKDVVTSIVSKDTDNILETTEDGQLKVSEYGSITPETINKLFTDGNKTNKGEETNGD